MTNGSRHIWIALTALLLPAACSKPPSKGSADASLPAPSITLSFTSARLLTPTRAAEILPDYIIGDPDVVPAPLIFGNGRIDSLNLDEPLILKQTGNVWTFVEMPTLNHTAWVYAGASYERKELWAILDSTPASSGPGLYLLRSTDHGETWSMFSALKPPTLAAEFVGFSMTAKGTGRITVHQDDDTDATPRGLYAYDSADGGKTWTGPVFSGDDLISADLPPFPTLTQSLQTLDGGGARPPPPVRGPNRGR